MRGFTLLELSIVLLVIGLIAGGITIGASMIEQAKYKRLMQQIDELHTAVGTFKTTYTAIPGDMSTATSMWGAAAACPTGGAQASGTCNGNGDLQIGAASSFLESRTFAQHLSLAKLTSGIYNANWVAPVVPGRDLIAAPFDNIGIRPSYLGTLSGDPNWYDGNYGHVYVVGRPNSTSATILDSWMRCEDAAALDKKFDDNMPGLGVIRNQRTNCTTDSSIGAAATAQYDPIGTTLTRQRYLWENE
jgi:prepilin-type N-terminal cleavage/methylation domain-containing protein